MVGEFKCGSALARKPSGFFQSVDILHKAVRLLQVGDVAGEGFVESLGTLYQSGESLALMFAATQSLSNWEWLWCSVV